MARFLVVLIISQVLVPSLGQQTSNGVAATSSSQDTQATAISSPSLGHTGIYGNSSISNSSTSDAVGFAIKIFIPFCHKAAVQSCVSIPVKQCKECNMISAGFFGFFVVLLGLGLLFGNGLVICIFAKDKSSFTGTYGKIKVSLAVSDLLTGFLFFGVILPNFVETLNQTSYEIHLKFEITQGTPEALGSGFFHIFIYTASFYHLVLLAQQRLYAVTFPLRYREQRPITVGFGIALVWCISFLIAVTPMWHPTIDYVYDCVIFLFAARSPNRYITLLFSFMTMVPYTLMVILAAATGICLHRRILGSRRKRENMIFFTLVLMVVGLTLTTGPYVMIVFLSWNEYADQPSFQLGFVICYYLSLANSIVNVLVYSVVDGKFRKSSRELLRKLFGLNAEPCRGGSSSFVSSADERSLHRISDAVKS